MSTSVQERGSSGPVTLGGVAFAVRERVVRTATQFVKGLGVDHGRPNRAVQVLTIAADPERIAAVLRDPEGLAQVLRNVAEVRPSGDRGAHVRAEVPGRTLEWDMRIAEERPGELLRWAAAPASSVPAEVEVRFAPSPAMAGTAVTMRIALGDDAGGPPLGPVAGAIAVKALHATKALIESGEVPTLAHNPSARPGAGDRI